MAGVYLDAPLILVESFQFSVVSFQFSVATDDGFARSQAPAWGRVALQATANPAGLTGGSFG